MIYAVDLADQRVYISIQLSERMWSFSVIESIKIIGFISLVCIAFVTSTALPSELSLGQMKRCFMFKSIKIDYIR